jgi:Ca2+-binding EF-hand superfamily protein
LVGQSTHHKTPLTLTPIFIDSYSTFENERDSKLPKRSISRALRALGIPVTDKEVNGYITALNTKDQSIDFNTFKTIVNQSLQVGRPSLQQTLDNSANLFKTEDGKINLQDMKQVLGIVCEKLDDDDLEEFLGNAKVDGNGNISIQDLKTLFSQ